MIGRLLDFNRKFAYAIIVFTCMNWSRTSENYLIQFTPPLEDIRSYHVPSLNYELLLYLRAYERYVGLNQDPTSLKTPH